MRVVETQKKRAENLDDENDMVDAYIACGGNADKSGCVRRETMIQIIKYVSRSKYWSFISSLKHSRFSSQDFGLTIDIEQLCNKVDTDGSGEIEFDEFSLMLSGSFTY